MQELIESKPLLNDDNFKESLDELNRRASLLNLVKMIKQIKNLEKLLKVYLVEHFEKSHLLQKEVGDFIALLNKELAQEGLSKSDYNELSHIFENKLVDIIILAKNIKTDKVKYSCCVDGCKEFAINSHTISRANNFRNGVNYYKLNNKGQSSRSDFFAKKIQTKDASTIPLFCASHDSALFKEIEGAGFIDVKNQEHLYLQNWRIFLAKNHHRKAGLVPNVRKQLFNNPQIIKNKSFNDFNVDGHINKMERDFFNEKRKIVYICITFNNNAPILASFSDSLDLLEKQNNFFDHTFYFHLLNNNKQQCLIISGFKTKTMVKALTKVKELFKKDPYEFWQKVFNIMPLQDNVFFTESLALNKVSLDKLKDTQLQKAKIKDLSLFSEVPTSFSKKELFNFFGMCKIEDNLVNAIEIEAMAIE